MADEAAMLAELEGLRLAAPVTGDVLAALAAGLLVAAVLRALVGGILARTPGSRAEIARAAAEARALAAPDRTVALAHLWRRIQRGAGSRPPELPADAAACLGPRLYRPGVPPDPAPLERAVLAAAARMRN